jgi:ketosteroid isomerase-like protein
MTRSRPLRHALFHCVAAACFAVALPVAARGDDVVATLPVDALPPVAVVDGFSAALKAGDLRRVRALVADDVLVLESGGAERSAGEYFAGHAAADVAFLRDAQVQVTHRTARVLGDVAWVGTESELHVVKGGAPLTLLSTETMVLARTADGWRIVHIHWSSRPESKE